LDDSYKKKIEIERTHNLHSFSVSSQINLLTYFFVVQFFFNFQSVRMQNETSNPRNVFASPSKLITVSNPAVQHSATTLSSTFDYNTTRVVVSANGEVTAIPEKTTFTATTQLIVPRTGVLIVGIGGNNGSTFTAGLLAHRLSLSWKTREGLMDAAIIGSLTQSSTIRLGHNDDGSEVYVPFSSLLPMLSPKDLVIGGWDISSKPLKEAVERAAVIDISLQRELLPHMLQFYPNKPLPSIYYPSFIAANQASRADNLLFDGGGTKQEHVDSIRSQIKTFKASHNLSNIIVLWSATTERFSEVRVGLNDSSDSLLKSIARNEAEVSPSTIFAVASILEGCSYINGSPQNTFVPGVIELAEAALPRVFLAGDDFKTGQTKIKSVLVDYLVNAGIKPLSVVSYNHLGNTDGENLSAPAQFRSKEISKASVIDDAVASNGLLYKAGEKPDHVVVIKYVPAVGDSKRALDEYYSRIFLGGTNTLVLHNTCEDSLLAVPVMLDLILCCELLMRIEVRISTTDSTSGELDTICSLLSYWLKAPHVSKGAPIVNALHRQREALVNFVRLSSGLPLDTSVDINLRLRATTPSISKISSIDLS
jgi:myo-inositol-1-phosphate synthase